MKRFFAIALVLLLCGVMYVGADDAKVMPARIGRFYVAPTFGFVNNHFNEDGESKSLGEGEGGMQLFNLGFALEYGIIDWLTAALQWAPGVNVWSDVDKDLKVSTSNVNANGVADLFVGAKMQFIGNQGLVQNDMFRLALAPGVKIPLPGPDYEEQNKNMLKNDPITGGNVDNHVFGAGARFYFDYVINDKFFVNLYSEFIGYPVKGDLKKSGIDPYAVDYGAKLTLMNTLEGMMAGTSALIPADLVIIDGGTVNYGYDLTFELEPVFSTSIAEATVFTAGLPFNFKLNPAKKYDYDLTKKFNDTADTIGAMAAGAGMPGVSDMIKNLVTDGIEENLNKTDDPSYIFTLKPNVSVFFMGWALPTEFKVSYSAPLAGKNKDALHSITMQVKLYFKI